MVSSTFIGDCLEALAFGVEAKESLLSAVARRPKADEAILPLAGFLKL
jgi:hypothetical protein